MQKTLNIGITGAHGYLGSGFVGAGCIPIFGNITKEDEIQDAIKSANVDVVIHCAAMTDVDECEQDFKSAYNVNVAGTANVVNSLSDNQTFYYMSSDHVFPGRENPFNFHGYTERHRPSPVNNYGYTKWGGEIISRQFFGDNTTIIRASKIFSLDTLRECIISLNSNTEHTFSKLVCRSFIHRSHFVKSVLDMITSVYIGTITRPEIINIAGNAILSYFQFWKTVADVYKLRPELVYGRSTPLENATPRPLSAGLDIGNMRSLGIRTYHPVDGIYYMLEDEKNEVLAI